MEIQQNKATDRRVQRTHQLLQDALISLIQEKDYDDITVQDLIDRANVGRSTFYSHFLDKDELLLSGLEKLRDSFEAQYQKLAATTTNIAEQRLALTLVFFQHAEANSRLFRGVIGKRSGAIITKKFHGFITNMFTEHLRGVSLPEDIPLELVVQFLASTLLALLTWWFDNEMPYTAEQMNRWYHRLALQMMHPA